MKYYKEDDLMPYSEVYAMQLRMNDYYISICLNSETPFCRAEKKGCCSVLGNVNRDTPYLDRYDELCPKIARGITAWLLYFAPYHKDIEELVFLNSQKNLISRDDFFKGYKDLLHSIYKSSLSVRYKHYEVNNRLEDLKRLNDAFTNEHINREREYINNFTRHECMSEEWYNAVKQCANEYIKWVEDEKRNEVQEEATNKSLNERPSVFHADKLNFALLLNHLKDCTNRKRKIVDIDITTEEFANRILSADLSVFPQKVYKIFFLKQMSEYYINHGEQTLWYDDAVRKAGLTEKDFSQYNESSNTFIQDFNRFYYYTEQVNKAKSKGYR